MEDNSGCQSLAKGAGNTWLAGPIEVAMLPCCFGSVDIIVRNCRNSHEPVFISLWTNYCILKHRRKVSNRSFALKPSRTFCPCYVNVFADICRQCCRRAGSTWSYSCGIASNCSRRRLGQTSIQGSLRFLWCRSYGIQLREFWFLSP